MPSDKEILLKHLQRINTPKRSISEMDKQRLEYAKQVKGTALDTPEAANIRDYSDPEKILESIANIGGIESIGKKVAPSVFQKIKGLLSKKTPTAEKALHTPASAEEFHEAVSKASTGRPDVAENVTKYTPEEYANMRTFLSPDKKSGFAIKPDNELVSVFSAQKGLNRGDAIVKDAIGQGAEHLDAFDPYLPKLYGKHGFEEYKRVPNYTPGGPDVVYMRRPSTKLASEAEKTLPPNILSEEDLLRKEQQKQAIEQNIQEAKDIQLQKDIEAQKEQPMRKSTPEETEAARQQAISEMPAINRAIELRGPEQTGIPEEDPFAALKELLKKKKK